MRNSIATEETTGLTDPGSPPDTALGTEADAQLNIDGQSGEVTEDTSNEYTDGTFAATGTYTSPAGPEEVSVSVTLSEGIVEAVTFEGLAENQTSIRYQQLFADNFEALVVGKSIDEVSLDKVSGSSLTSAGFNAAIEDIKSQAS